MSLPERATRAAARSTRAMVASPHALATAAGVDVLRRGGNAVDAAIATNAVLTVVYPTSCGIGGDAFWVIYEPKSEDVLAYNGSGRAPRALTADLVRSKSKAMPQRGAFSVTVPGAVRSWDDVARAHGTRGLDELLAPAEAYARDGFSATDVNAAYFALNEAMLRADPDANALFMTRGVPRAGDLLRNEPLANVLSEIRRGGADAFYTGRTAEAIATTVAAGGNPMTVEDLASHRTELMQPAKISWKGAEVHAHPPNSQGAVALMVLGALENDGDASDADWTHLAVEAIKYAVDARDARFAEPAAMTGPIDDLLAPEALRALRAKLDPRRARPRPPPDDRGGTIAIVAVDDEGRAVSLIESLYMNFGSGIVARGTGVFLQNRGAYFSLDPNSPNVLGGGKRPLHTLAPGMLLRNGKPEFVYGTMGGDGQPQTHVQLIHAIYERGLDVQAAIDAPRFVYGRDADMAFADALRVESRFDPAVLAALRERGHAIFMLGAYENALGHAMGVTIDSARGTLTGGADPRADSLALGL